MTLFWTQYRWIDFGWANMLKKKEAEEQIMVLQYSFLATLLVGYDQLRCSNILKSLVTALFRWGLKDVDVC